MRVVLIDPSRTASMFVTQLLEVRGHEVGAFEDGLEGLAAVKSDPEVGAVITSAEPKSISGMQLCWEARLLSTPQRPIYVIMMSATVDDKTLIEALDSGADDFLRKPPVAEELYARLRAAERFAVMQRELFRLATTDSLTGMFNRRAFFEQAHQLCARAGAKRPLSAIMMDVDHFKNINDTYGHDSGDEVLRAVALRAMAEKAVAGRLGGEEFALLLDCALPEAVARANRLRVAMAAMEIDAAGRAVTLTCSFGVSEWCDGDTIDALLKRADMALYEAKLGGRNRVVPADGTAMTASYPDIGRPIRTLDARKSA